MPRSALVQSPGARSAGSSHPMDRMETTHPVLREKPRSGTRRTTAITERLEVPHRSPAGVGPSDRAGTLGPSDRTGPRSRRPPARWVRRVSPLRHALDERHRQADWPAAGERGHQRPALADPGTPPTGSPPMARSPAAPPVGAPIGYVVTPRIGLDAVVVEGVGAAQRRGGPGHYARTERAESGRHRRHRRHRRQRRTPPTPPRSTSSTCSGWATRLHADHPGPLSRPRRLLAGRQPDRRLRSRSHGGRAAELTLTTRTPGDSAAQRLMVTAVLDHGAGPVPVRFVPPPPECAAHRTRPMPRPITSGVGRPHRDRRPGRETHDVANQRRRASSRPGNGWGSGGGHWRCGGATEAWTDGPPSSVTRVWLATAAATDAEARQVTVLDWPISITRSG